MSERISAMLRPALLHVIAGRRFEFAEPFLIVLSVTAAIDIAGFALEPFHNARGRPGRVLRSRIVAALVYVIALAVLLPMLGPIGAAYASAATAVVLVGQLAHSAYDIFRRAPIKPSRGSS